MKKKLLALAVAGAFALPAAVLAQGSNVTIYGTLNMDFENAKADGSTAGSASDLPARNRVASNSSNIGFKGTEDLGNGLKAIFQIESGVNMDSGASSTSTGTFATRNSQLGLSSAWGTLFLGNWDTPYKSSTVALDPFYATSVASYLNVLSTLGHNQSATPTGAITTTPTSFDRRANNVVQYWTPNWGGFSARVAYEANEGRTTAVNPYLWSVAGMYDNGPIYVSLAYQKHNDALAGLASVGTPAITLGSPTSSDDHAWKLGAGYRFGNTRIIGVYERLRYGTTGATALGVNNLKKTNWLVGVSHKMGPHILRATYGRANDGSCTLAGGAACTATDSSGAKAYSLGYGYTLSKRTELYAFWTEIRNESAAAYNFAINALGTVANGSDPRAFGLGVRHTF